MTTAPPVGARMLAEALGTGFLVAAVVGSGIQAERLSPGDVGLQLLESSTATALALVALILCVGPVSGAHLNPVVTLAERLTLSDTSAGIAPASAPRFVAAQVVGALLAVGCAHVLFAPTMPVPVAASNGERDPSLEEALDA